MFGLVGSGTSADLRDTAADEQGAVAEVRAVPHLIPPHRGKQRTKQSLHCPFCR